jgi:hypothetical protein
MVEDDAAIGTGSKLTPHRLSHAIVDCATARLLSGTNGIGEILLGTNPIDAEEAWAIRVHTFLTSLLQVFSMIMASIQ